MVRAAAIAIVSGNHQQANAGERLGQPLVVRVTDAAGKGVGNVGVSFDVTGDGGLNGKDASGPSRVYSQTIQRARHKRRWSRMTSA